MVRLDLTYLDLQIAFGFITADMKGDTTSEYPNGSIPVLQMGYRLFSSGKISHIGF